MLVGSNSPKLARTDINDMFADLGYGASGNVSPVTTTGEANKIFKFSSIANTILHFLRIKKSSTTALNIQNDSGVDVFNVDSINNSITISSLAGAGNRMVFADSTGNLKSDDCCLNLTTGNNVSIKISKNISLANNVFSDLFNFYSLGGFPSANYVGAITGELKIKILGLNSFYETVSSYRSFSISVKQQAAGNITITNIATKDTLDNGVIPTVTVQAKSGNTNTSSKIELSVTFPNFLECNVIAEIECLSISNLSNNLIKVN